MGFVHLFIRFLNLCITNNLCFLFFKRLLLNWKYFLFLYKLYVIVLTHWGIILYFSIFKTNLEWVDFKHLIFNQEFKCMHCVFLFRYFSTNRFPGSNFTFYLILHYIKDSEKFFRLSYRFRTLVWRLHTWVMGGIWRITWYYFIPVCFYKFLFKLNHSWFYYFVLTIWTKLNS